jgi:hypothetical protein
MRARFLMELGRVFVALAIGNPENPTRQFGYFQNSCGVVNVADFKGRIEAEPKWITRQKGGEGFVEQAEKLLQSR